MRCSEGCTDMPMSSLRQLRKRTVPLRPSADVDTTTVTDDPLGLAVQGRARDADIAARLHGQVPIGGPLPDLRWQGFFQALDDAGVSRLVGGPSAPGSNQIRGQSVMPRSSGTAGDALERVAASMPFDDDAAPELPAAPTASAPR